MKNPRGTPLGELAEPAEPGRDGRHSESGIVEQRLERGHRRIRQIAEEVHGQVVR